MTADFPYPIDPTPYSRTDFYLGNRKIRRSHSQPTQWTADLIAEYERCRDDIDYFTRRYVKIINPDRGLELMQCYPYQEKMWHLFEDNRFSVILASRQSGKTMGVVAYLLHTCIFKSNQTIAIVAHLQKQARTIMRRVCMAMENLPFWLQPGCKSFSKASIEFDNGTLCFASASDNNSLRGESINLLYLDEFAFVQNDVEFMRGTYPVVTAGKKTKIIVTSTANGISNEFHSLYTAAVEETNNFKHMRVDWSDVPGRDEAWKVSTIRDIGEKRFRVEFGNSFEGTSLTLIDANKLLLLRPAKPVWEGDDGARVYKKPESNHSYVITADLSKGRGKDYSTFTITDTSVNPFEQVAAYSNSLISPMHIPVLLLKYAKAYNEAVVVIESNGDGAEVARDLLYDLEYDNVFIENMKKADGIGIFVNQKVKNIGCSKLKDIVESGAYLVRDHDTISELKCFERKGKSYEAREGKHDDLVDNLWLFSYFTSTTTFRDHTAVDIKSTMRAEAKRRESEQAPFIGIFGEQPDLMEEMIARGYYPAHFVPVDKGDDQWDSESPVRPGYRIGEV